MILLELKKLRRTRLGVLILVGMAGMILMSVARILGNTAGMDFLHLLVMAGMFQALLFPMFVSIIATRLVEIEHAGNGWQISGTAGIPRGKLCTIKAILTVIITTMIVALEFAAIIAIGFLRLGPATFDASYWLPYALCLMLVNASLGLLHVILAAYVDNQLVNLGVGVLGAFIAMFSLLIPDTVTRFIPWGYYAMSMHATFTPEGAEYIRPDYGWIAGFCALAVVAFGVGVYKLNRMER